MLQLTVEQVVERALRADQTPTDYQMGGGVMQADATVPWAPFQAKDGKKYPRGCDCSAFTCWASGVDKHDREVRNSAGQRLYWGTDNIYGDAVGAQRRFRQIAQAVRGCSVVYPSWVPPGKDRRSGHVGLVLDPTKRLIIDCADSPDDDRPGVGDGITQRVADFFWNPAPPNGRRGAIFVWPLNVAGGPS